MIDFDKVESVTLYTGDNGSSACTCACPCCSQKGRERRYQGTEEQVNKLFELLPNLKQLYLFGNPDITVDTSFCNQSMKEAVSRGVRVCCSTSGIGGVKTLQKLLKEIPSEMVDYVSFSFDGVTKEELSIAKGVNYPIEKAMKGLKWAIDNGYTVKVQPTLWSFNYAHAGEIIRFFHSMGVTWFTFHIGSLESGVNLPTHRHLTPKQVKAVLTQIDKAIETYKDIKVRCPVIFPECGKFDESKWYCMNPERCKELLVIFKQEGIWATHAPIASCLDERMGFMLDGKKITVPKLTQSQTCPYSVCLSGTNKTWCRYISNFWNY